MLLQFLAKFLGGKAGNRHQAPRRPQVRVAVEELEQRSLLSAVSAAATLATTSTNWSGYAVETSLTTPQANAVSAVGGSWVVPTVTGTGTTYSAEWVGIDGYSSATVEQIGIEADTVNGKAVYSAWYEMYPSSPVTISTLAVQPGDAISAEVSYAAGKFTLEITDSTTGKSFSTVQAAASAQRSSAEWIAEAPSSGFGILPIANFGTVSFSNAWATVNGTTGPIDSSAWQDALINLTAGSSQHDTTSALTDSTTTVGTSTVTASSFTVTYSATSTQPTQPTPPTRPTPPPPPGRHHFFETEMAASFGDTASSTADIQAIAIAGSHVTTTLVVGQETASPATGESPPTVQNPVLAGSALAGSTVVQLRPGSDLDSSEDDTEELATQAGDAGRQPAVMSLPAPTLDRGVNMAVAPAPKMLDPIPKAAVTRYFASSFVREDSLQDAPPPTADPSSIDLLWSIGMTAFVTDWSLGLASSDSRKKCVRE